MNSFLARRNPPTGSDTLLWIVDQTIEHVLDKQIKKGLSVHCLCKTISLRNDGASMLKKYIVPYMHLLTTT